MNQMTLRPLAVIAALCLLILVGCNTATPTPAATPTLAPVTFSFPVQAPLPASSALMDDQLVISGGLFIEIDPTCLRFRLDTGEQEFTPVWPVGYAPANDPVSGGIMVINERGQLAARTGVNFTMSGTEMTAQEYEVVFGEPLISDCSEPYWVVSQVFSFSPD